MASVSSESSSQRNRTHLGQLNGTIFYLVEGSKIYFCSQQQLLAHYPIFTPEDHSPSQFSANTWGLCTWALREESSEYKRKGLSDSHLGNNDTAGNRLDEFPRSAHENTKKINTTILKTHTKHMWSDGLYWYVGILRSCEINHKSSLWLNIPQKCIQRVLCTKRYWVLVVPWPQHYKQNSTCQEI